MSAIAEELRDIADIAEAGDKFHWAKLMRCAAAQLIAGDREIEELKNAVEAEREACARACNVLSDECKPLSIAGAYMRQAYDYSAEAIRARGKK